MKLSRKSWFVRWAYLGESMWAIPAHTTVCTLFARAFLLSPISGIVFLMITPFIGLAWIGQKLKLDRDVPMPAVVRIAGQRVSDWRNRVCSIVEIE